MEKESKKKKHSNKKRFVNTTMQAHVSKLPDDCLIHIFSLLPIVDRMRIKAVCTRWKTLSILSWSSCKTLRMNYNDWGLNGITRFILRNVLQHCGKYITGIDFSHYFYFGYDKRNEILGSTLLFKDFYDLCPNLTILRLHEIKVSTQSVEYLARTQSKLKEIKMQCIDVDKAVISLLFRNNPNLSIIGVNAPGACWLALNPTAALQRFIHLEEFEILDYNEESEFMMHADAFLEAISLHGNKLKVLRLYPYYQAVTIRSIHFKNFQNLQEVSLSGTEVRINDDFFKVISTECIKIVKISLQGLQVTDSQIVHIVNLPKLQELHLEDLEVTDAIFFHNLPCLTKFYCSKCPYMKNLGLCELLHESARNLESFRLDGYCQNIDMDKLVQDAKEATDSRTNGPVLKMSIPVKRRSPTSPYYEDRIKIKLSKYFELSKD